ncbi:MAG: FG-GAP-like repeat-containing protein [Blastocatellia bacterium]
MKLSRASLGKGKAAKEFSANPVWRLVCLSAVVGIIVISSTAVFSGRTSSSVVGTASAARARLGSAVGIQAAGRGNPWMNMTDGHEVLAAYEGSGSAVGLMSRDQGRPLSLASADFDEDGMPDLIAGYAGGTGGIITLHRGNVDSVYPNTEAARRRKAEGTFTDVPFISPAQVFDAAVPPDFIEAGDFNADGHQDLVIASREHTSIYFLPGDGSDRFKSSEAIVLPSRVTALASGDVNRADGMPDLVVAVEGTGTPKLLVFEGPQGAARSEPEEFELPSAASAIKIGYLSDAPEADIAVAAGDELLIVRGRDRKLFLEERERAGVPAAQITRRAFPSKLVSLAIGDFVGDLNLDLGVASEDGTVLVLSERGTQAASTKPNSQDDFEIETLASNLGPSKGMLVAARLSSLLHETLVLSNEKANKLQVWIDVEDRRNRNDLTLSAAAGEREPAVALDVDQEPVAVLPMRLNGDAISDLVVLRKGHAAPLILQSIAGVKTVSNTSDCGSVGCGSLRAAIMEANSSPGADTIQFGLDGVPTITIGTPFPAITEALTADGTQQSNNGPGLNVLQAVQITSTTNVATAFNVGGSGCVVSKFVINKVGDAIRISNGTQSIVEGNLIGTTSNGNAISQNSKRGVFIDNTARNTIGGNPQAGRINVISGNALGIDINGSNANENVVRFNLIGENASGGVALGNRGNGVRITNGGSRNRIGVSSPTSVDNHIYGSQASGVAIVSGTGNLVQANLFQVNLADGVNVGSSGNTVGGTGRALANFIWSSSDNGVEITGVATNNLVQGNRIGLDFDNGGNPLNRLNSGHGVATSNNASGNFIGGAVDLNQVNFIAFNSGDGVSILSGTGNRILINSIFSNAGMGIDLANDGRDVNDDKDGDSGPNNKQNFPVLVSVVNSAAAPSGPSIQSPAAVVTISVTLNSTPNQNFDIDFYSCSNSCAGTGDQFVGCIPQPLGTRSVTTGADGNFSGSFQFDLGVNVSTGFVNAKAMNTSNGDTSEFSSCAAIGSCTFSANPTTASVGSAAGNGSFTIAAAAGCAWTATSNAAFLTTSSSGNGNGTVNYSFQQNTTGAQRTGVITVGNATHTVTQDFQVTPDFSLSFEQSPVTGLNGTKARITVIINRTGGFTGQVTLTPPPKQNGVKPKPPDPITTLDSSATFKMKIAFGLEPSSRQLTFTGTDQTGRTRTATATLIIQ